MLIISTDNIREINVLLIILRVTLVEVILLECLESLRWIGFHPSVLFMLTNILSPLESLESTIRT